MLRILLLLTLLPLAAAVVVVQRAPQEAESPVTAGALGGAATLAVGEPPDELPARELPALASLSATLERPLFTPARRPWEALREAPPEDTGPAVSSRPPPPPPRLALTAVFRAANAEIALLRRLDGGGVLRVGVGEVIDGWQVLVIDAESVLLASGAERHLLELPGSNRGRAAPARGVAPPSGLLRSPPAARQGTAAHDEAARP